MYYSVGFLYFKEQELKARNDTIEYIGFELADIKTLLFDIDGCCRGLGGCKKPFDYKELPSYSKYNKNKDFNTNVNETEEERLERHKKFFESLKSMVKNNKDQE